MEAFLTVIRTEAFDCYFNQLSLNLASQIFFKPFTLKSFLCIHNRIFGNRLIQDKNSFLKIVITSLTNCPR